MATPIFVLVHSPLVGPYTWSLVAEELKRRGLGVAVPRVRDRGEAAGPFWWQHAMAAASMLGALPRGRPLVLAGHSGAGPLLPAIRQVSERQVDAYVFVDAGLPDEGRSRLDGIHSDSPEFAAEFEAHLAAGGRYPEWSDADLAEIVPDQTRRQRLLADLQPRARAFWEEPLPVVPGWPDAPCAYLRFSAVYAEPAAQARREGWACVELDAGHFHMLVDPAGVTDALLELVRGMGIPVAAR